MTSSYAQSTWYVKADASGSNNGSSWTDAYTDLQSALGSASSGDEIWVAAGTYYPTSTTDRTIYFEMVSGVSMYGGFAGTESTLGERDWLTNETILSGEIGSAGTIDDNSYHVLIGASSSILDGFIIRDGFANHASTDAEQKGGGLAIYGSNGPDVSNCKFINNRALEWGGAIYNLMSNISITNCYFIDNQTTSTDAGVARGGAIYNDDCLPTIYNCVFKGNTAYYGGALYNNPSGTSSQLITNCTFYQNSVMAGDGTAIADEDVSSTITNCILWGNSTAYETFTSVNGTTDHAISYSVLQSLYSGPGAGSGIIYEDPLFVSEDDLSLQYNSPCVDAGDGDATQSSTDILGNPRFDNTLVTNTGTGATAYTDIGAFEYYTSDLMGLYVIDKAGSGDWDYLSFDAAVTDLASGIGGPVVFDVVAGTYDEQITLTEIPGASSTNTVTFQSATGDSTDVILSNASTDVNNNFTVKLDGADYVRFKKMTIKASGSTYARVIEIDNEATNNEFLNNELLGVEGKSAIVYSNASPDSSNVFSGNYFKDGKFGIYLHGTLTNYLTVSDNTFWQQTDTAIYVQYFNLIDIHSNLIYSQNRSTGIYLYDNRDQVKVNANRIYLPAGGNGIHLYSVRLAGSETSQIFNNHIYINSSEADKGIYVQWPFTSNINIYHNTIHIEGENTSSACYDFETSGDPCTINMFNNNFANMAAGMAIGTNYGGGDYNNLYSNGPLVGPSSADLTEWQDNFNKDHNSISVDPVFDPDTSYHVFNPLLNDAGTPLADVTDDLDGDSRDPANPDIGADEFTPPNSPLSGNFTIAETGADYPSVYEAVADLIKFGINGPVKYSISGDTLFEQINIPEIIGASPTNTITFESASGDSTATVIKYTPLYESKAYTLKLDGTDYIIIKNLSITSGESWGIPLMLENDATHNQFSNNRFYFGDFFTHNTDYKLVYSTAGIDSSNYFISNVFENSSNGIFFESGAEPESDLRFQNNIFDKILFRGINMNNAKDLLISGNQLKDTVVTANGAGFWIRNSNGRIFNNFILNKANLQSYGIYLSNSEFEVYHNTIKLVGTGASSTYAFYTGGGDNMIVKNNIFVNQATGRAIYADTTGLVSDYNLLYTNGSLLASSINNLNSADLEEWQTESEGRDLHSISRLPEFVSETDLHTTDPWISNLGTPIAEVTVDIDGESRDAETPDIGADEFEAGDIFDGSYTIGPTGDFASFTEAVDSISQVGAIDTVTFLVQAGTYTEQFTIKEIPYVTDSIPVTFRAENDGDQVILEFSNTETDNYLIKLDSADHLTFQGMTFRALNPDYARIIQIENGATNNQFIDNIFESSGTEHAIIFSLGDQDHGNVFNGNTLTGGKVGIQMIGTSDAEPETAIQILNNEFFDQFSAGIYLKYLDTPRVVNNRILHENMIEGQYEGIALLNCSGYNQNYGLIANNVIAFQADQLSGGIVFDATSKQKIYHNSVYITGSSTETRCLNQQNGGTDNYARNNIFMNDAGGLVIYMPGTSSVLCDYNNLYTTGDHLAYTDISIESLANWQSSYGQDANSLSLDPDFISPTDLHTYHPLLNGAGTPLAEVSFDLTGKARDSSNPDIGAYEFVDAVFDLGPDTLICKNTTITLDAGAGFDSYAWNTGETTSSITVDTTGVTEIYFGVTVTHNANEYVDSLMVSFTGPEINLGDTTGFCTGETITLNAGSGYADYLWSTGSTEQSIVIGSQGEFYVEVTDAQGCSDTDTVTVIESAGPEVDLGQDQELCHGQTLDLNAGSGADFLWSDGSTTQVITITEGGEYAVLVTDAYGCVDKDTIQIDLLDSPTVDLGDSTGFCSGGEVVLNAGGSGTDTYQWSTGLIDQELVVWQEGEYYVTATNASGCSSSDTVYVEEYPNPSVSIIQQDDQLMVENPDETITYQWYREGVELDAETGSSYTPTQQGEYYVNAITEDGCESSSNIINYVTTSLADELLANGIRIFPNPADQVLYMEITHPGSSLEFRLLDLTGKIVYDEKFEMRKAGNEIEINVSNLKKGTYILRIRSEHKVVTGKIMIR